MNRYNIFCPSQETLERYVASGRQLYSVSFRNAPQLFAHLKTCKDCQLRVEALQQLRESRAREVGKELVRLIRQGNLRLPERHLGGKECPNEEQLAYYTEGSDEMFDPGEKTKITQHLQRCEYCREAVRACREEFAPQDFVKKLWRKFWIITIIIVIISAAITGVAIYFKIPWLSRWASGTGAVCLAFMLVIVDGTFRVLRILGSKAFQG